jgi:hypothetical protein
LSTRRRREKFYVIIINALKQTIGFLLFNQRNKIFHSFCMNASHDDIYNFYERLGISQALAKTPGLGLEILGAAWAAFSDGEIDIPLGNNKPNHWQY